MPSGAGLVQRELGASITIQLRSLRRRGCECRALSDPAAEAARNQVSQPTLSLIVERLKGDGVQSQATPYGQLGFFDFRLRCTKPARYITRQGLIHSMLSRPRAV